MKLHLGCGLNYLPGYINIDYPLSEHSVQKKSVADRHVDILKIRNKKNSTEEVRLHHVFEHFPRPTACALLVGWNMWLEKRGRLDIEVPDFDAMARIVVNPFSKEADKYRALRHTFGSHEEKWAVHWDGWSLGRLSDLISILGYRVIEKKSIKNGFLRNIEIIAIKDRSFSLKTNKRTVKNYLSKYLISQKNEKSLLKEWLEQYDAQVKQMVI